MAMARPVSDAKKRFNAKWKAVESGCHEWQAILHRDGYGKFYWEGRQVGAHRVAYILRHGNIPNGLNVLHHCDNRKCVNPDHLYAGTSVQNAADKVARCGWWGRMKYTQHFIDACRAWVALGFTQTRVAEILGVDQTTVSLYVRGQYRPRKFKEN